MSEIPGSESIRNDRQPPSRSNHSRRVSSRSVGTLKVQCSKLTGLPMNSTRKGQVSSSNRFPTVLALSDLFLDIEVGLVIGVMTVRTFPAVLTGGAYRHIAWRDRDCHCASPSEEGVGAGQRDGVPLTLTGR